MATTNPFEQGYDRANPNVNKWLDQDDMFPLQRPPTGTNSFEKPEYDPNKILSRLISPTTIQEKKNSRGVGTLKYDDKFEGFWADCGESKKWADRKPTWGRAKSECELIEVPVMPHETDSAVTFLYKVCKFPAAGKGSVYPTKEGSSFNPDDAMDLCVMAKGFLAEYQGNRQELVGTFQDLDVEPKLSKQRPAIMFYGVGSMDPSKISYPGFSDDFRADKMTDNSDQMNACREAKTARDNTVTQTLTALRAKVRDAISTNQKTIPLSPQELKPIEDANRQLAQVCFPKFNRKSSQDAKSLALDTLAGNIVQMASLPVSDPDEIKDFIDDPLNTGLKNDLDKYPVDQISDARCKHSREIAWQMCTNLPAAFLANEITVTTNACGAKTSSDIRQTILPGNVAQKDWLKEFEKKIDDISPTQPDYKDACDNAKGNIKTIARNVHDRIALNPALGKDGKSCAVVSDRLACGMLDTNVPIPALPSMDETVEQMVNFEVFNGLLGRGSNSFNCADANNEDSDAFKEACDPLTLGKGILSDEATLTKLMKTYGISGDPDDACKTSYPDDSQLQRRNQCRVLGKIVPEVCGGSDPYKTAETWCSTYRRT